MLLEFLKIIDPRTPVRITFKVVSPRPQLDVVCYFETHKIFCFKFKLAVDATLNVWMVIENWAKRESLQRSLVYTCA